MHSDIKRNAASFPWRERSRRAWTRRAKPGAVITPSILFPASPLRASSPPASSPPASFPAFSLPARLFRRASPRPALILAVFLTVSLAVLLAGCLGVNTGPYRSKPGHPGQAGTGNYGQGLVLEANAQRAVSGLESLAWDPVLAGLARDHAEDMARRGEMDHAGFEERFRASGYRLCVENVARSQADAPTLVRLWMDSPGHKANLLRPELRLAGAARSGLYAVWLACKP